MELMDNLQLVCPVRGQLKIKKKSKDGLSSTEEFYRVEDNPSFKQGLPKREFLD